MNLSIFQNFTTIIENKPFADILNDIKTGKYRGPVTYIRKCLQEQKLESYEKAKKGFRLSHHQVSSKVAGTRIR